MQNEETGHAPPFSNRGTVIPIRPWLPKCRRRFGYRGDKMQNYKC